MVYNEEKRVITGWWIFGIIILLLTIAIIAIFAAGLNPFVKNIETSTTRQTMQYRTSTETMLLDQMQQWQKLDTDIAKYERDPANTKIVDGMRAQQATILKQMHTKADQIPNATPQAVKNFLAAHPLQ